MALWPGSKLPVAYGPEAVSAAEAEPLQGLQPLGFRDQEATWEAAAEQ